MVKRRRNNIVLWDWSPDGTHHQPVRRRTHAVGRDALTAIALLGTILLVLSQLPPSTSGNRRGRLAEFVCESAGMAPGTASCFGLAIGFWFVVVVTVGIVFTVARLGYARLIDAVTTHEER